MRLLWVALAALVIGIAGATAVQANGPTPATYGGYQVVSKNVTGSFNGAPNVDVTAKCPDASWSVSGGGFSGADTRTTIVASHDVEDASGVGGWYVGAINSVTSGSVTAFVICAKLG